MSRNEAVPALHEMVLNRATHFVHRPFWLGIAIPQVSLGLRLSRAVPSHYRLLPFRRCV